MALAHTRLKVFSRSSRRTVGSLAYRAGVCLLDKQTGELHDYSKKQVHSVDLLIPEDAPQWAKNLQKKISENRTAGVQELSDRAEAAEKRKDSQVYREYEFSLHRELTDAQNKELALKFLQEQFCSKGMMVKANFHFDVDKEGNRKPHCHAVMLTRRLEEHGLSPMKERSWNHKDLATEWRKEFCNYSNAAFKKLGLDVVLDPRTYAEQGINIEPQTKLSRNTLEIEHRHGANPKDILSTPVTTRGQDFQEISLRNLYKIIDNPKIVLEDISKQQMTFMWGDVVKFLARHIDDQALFERVCLKLENSDELICVKDGGSLSQRVFTTKTRLEEETRFVESVRSLKDIQTHAVDPDLVQSVIDSTNTSFQERYKDPKASLSDDQVRAIHHMASSHQLSFIEGYAGAGKTTVMRGMKEIWESSGFKVYGLAPTGRATDNLADCGINAQTVDRFLRSYEQGHNQLKSQSVLVLDEAGMVSSKNFTALIEVTKQLGIKLIACGDRGQLSPVEAGAPFRLAIAEIGKADLTTVLRQKVPWQSQATSLFGEGKTEDALRLYGDHGRIKFVEESLPRNVVEQYNLSRRITGNIAHEMNQDIERAKEHGVELSFKKHQDYPVLIDWKNTRDACTKELFQNIKTYKDVMKELGVDGVDFCNKVINHPQNLTQAYDKYRLAQKLGVDWRLDVTHTCDPRLETKKELLSDWFKSTQDHPDAKQAMMAYSNKDVLHLNMMARQLKKESGKIGKEEFTYIIERNDGEELGKRKTLLEERTFSKGDQIVFTENNTGLGVRNGTLGQITSLDKSKITATFKEEGVEKEVSFSPNLYKRFDNGWALTIHKNQGATVDLSFILASFEQYRNLSYVGMTRHEKDAKLYGSNFDFYRDEKLYDRLGRHQDKLSSLDYLSPEDSEKLLKPERDRLNKTFEAVGRKLDAAGYVGSRAWGQICDKFLGRTPESNLIRVDYEALHYHKTEATRADEVLRGVKYDDSILPKDIIPKVSAETKVKNTNGVASKEKRDIPDTQGEAVEHMGGVEGFHKPQKQHRPRKKQLTKTEKFALADRALKSCDTVSLSKDVLRKYVHSEARSNNRSVAFQDGKLIYNLSGQYEGSVHCYKTGKTTPLFQKIREEKGLDFKGALSYILPYCRGSVIQDVESYLQGKKIRESSPEEIKAHKAAEEALNKKRELEHKKDLEHKAAGVQSCLMKSVSIKGTPAETYLRNERGIKGELSDSLRYLEPKTSFTYGDKNPYVKTGALVSIAKTLAGDTKAIQLTYLTAEGKRCVDDTGKKFIKATYGSPTGAFVELQKGDSKSPIILAEGVETALSVKEAGLKGQIYCSLGISNMEKLEVKDRDVIIAADWDGSTDKPSWALTEKAKAALEDKGNRAHIILPVQDPKSVSEKRDFNDVLTKDGVDSVQSLLERQVPGSMLSISLPRENQPESQHDEKTVSFSNHKDLSQADQSEPSTNASQNKEPDQPLAQVDQKTLQETTIKENILAYFEKELSKPENKNWTKEYVFEDVHKDPVGMLQWWQKDCGGDAFDPTKPLVDQKPEEQIDLTLDKTAPLSGEDFAKDFAKDLKNLDESIERVRHKQDYQGAFSNYTHQREEMLKGVDGSKMQDLKSYEPDLANRVEDHQKQQEQTRGPSLGL